MLQETRHVQSKVRGPGEVVWVCVHPANYLDDGTETHGEKRKREREQAQKNKLKIEMSETKGSRANTPKARNPSKLKPILPQ